MTMTSSRLRRLQRLERVDLDPQRVGQALFAALEPGGLLPEDPVLAKQVRRFIDTLDAIEVVQRGVSEDYEANSSEMMSENHN